MVASNWRNEFAGMDAKSLKVQTVADKREEAEAMVGNSLLVFVAKVENIQTIAEGTARTENVVAEETVENNSEVVLVARVENRENEAVEAKAENN